MALGGIMAMSLSACATLPSNGPTAGQVKKGADTRNVTHGGVPYRIIEIDSQNSSLPAPVDTIGLLQLAALSADPAPVRTDVIRPGDALTVSIFEVGVSLFSGQTASDQLRTPTAATQTIALTVREDGTVDLPYIGRLVAAGTYPEVLAATIKAQLRRLSEHPEVLVNVGESLENVGIVSGAVAKPGRIRLTSARERLLDAVALAGGANIAPADAEVRLIRGQKAFATRLSDVHNEDLANVRLRAGDRVEVVKAPKSYTVFGAIEKVTQIPFETPQVTLAEALARATGPADARANPRGIYIFRWERGDHEAPPMALVYHINMLKSDSYFLAQNFQMHDKDVILVANAQANMAQKLINMINQLFSPALGIRYATE